MNLEAKYNGIWGQSGESINKFVDPANWPVFYLIQPFLLWPWMISKSNLNFNMLPCYVGWILEGFYLFLRLIKPYKEPQCEETGLVSSKRCTWTKKKIWETLQEEANIRGSSDLQLQGYSHLMIDSVEKRRKDPWIYSRMIKKKGPWHFKLPTQCNVLDFLGWSIRSPVN